MDHTTTYPNNRKVYIDFAKGIAILSVVLGHLVLYGRMVFVLIFAFHMPFFFLLCGFMQKETLPNFKDFVFKKATRLLGVSFICRLIYCISCLKSQPISSFSARTYLLDLFWNPTIEWFLPVMFWVSISMYLFILVQKKLHNDKLLVLLSIILIAAMTLCAILYPFRDTMYLPFKLDSFALALSFAIIGYWLKKAEILDFCIEMYSSVPRRILRTAVLFCILVIYAFLAIFNAISHDVDVNMAGSTVGCNAVAYYVAGIIMFLLLLALGRKLENVNNIIVKWICLLGRHSILVYMAHMTIITGITNAIEKMSNGQIVWTPLVSISRTGVIVCFVISTLLLTALCLVWDRITTRIRKTPRLPK